LWEEPGEQKFSVGKRGVIFDPELPFVTFAAKGFRQRDLPECTEDACRKRQGPTQ